MRDARDAVYGSTSRLQEIALDLDGFGAHDAARLLHSVMSAGKEEHPRSPRVPRGRSRDTGPTRHCGRRRIRTQHRRLRQRRTRLLGPGGHRYITARSDEQELVAPLIVGLLTQIQRAVYRRHRRLATAGLENKAGAAPVLFALDELYSLAPLRIAQHALRGRKPGPPHRRGDPGPQPHQEPVAEPGGRFHDDVRPRSRVSGDPRRRHAQGDLRSSGNYDREKRERNVKAHPAQGGLSFVDYDGPMEDKEESASIQPSVSPVMTSTRSCSARSRAIRTDLRVRRSEHRNDTGDAVLPLRPVANAAHLLSRAGAVRARPRVAILEVHLSGEQPEVEDTLLHLPTPRLDDWAANPARTRAIVHGQAGDSLA